MNPIYGEDKFQEWVQARITGVQGHFHDHRFSAQNDVPDLSCAVGGKDFWLELKYAEFKLLHKKYDNFVLPTLTRGQLEWLKKRELSGRAICGILAYFSTSGDYPLPGPPISYVFFMTARDYLKRIWKKRFSAGGIVLSPYACSVNALQTGDRLFAFIERAAGRAADNEPVL